MPERLISIVVPVYNEAENIAACLAGLSAALAGEPHEILVCYDFDGDTTLGAIAAMSEPIREVRLVHNTLGRGAAFAIRAGFAAARGDAVIVTMADLADDPLVIPRMAERVRAGASVVAGSRYMPGGSQEGGPVVKGLLSRLAGASLHTLAGLGTHDATNTFRAYAASYLERVTIESTRGFDISLELTVKAHLMGLGVDEVPSYWRDRTAGESRFRLVAWLPLYLKWYLLALFTDALPDRARGRSPWLFLAAWIVLTLAIAQFPTTIAGNGVDGAWPVALADGFARRWTDGIDTVFTYGPYGWMYTALYYPATFGRAIALELAFKTILAFWLVRAAFALPAVSAVAFGVLSAWVAREDALLWLGFLLAWRALFARSRPRWSTAVACTWLAFLGFIKGTFLVLTAVAIGLFAVLCRERSRDVCFVIVAWVAAVLALWTAAGGRIGALPEWLGLTLEIVRGYTEGMGARYRPAWEVPVALAVSAALVIGARRGLTLVDLVACFAVFKQAFVRHDAYHAGNFWAWIVLFPLVTPAVPRRLAAVCAVTGLALLAPLRDLPRMASAAVDNVRYLASLGVVRRALDAQWELYRADHALPAIAARVGAESVDVLPGSQVSLLLLNGMNYRPRPMYSYKTLTVPLAEKNAEFFRSERAPRYILEAPLDVDGRWPDSFDALARAEVARRYDRVAEERGYALLERRATPRPAPLRDPVLARPLAFGERLDLSACAGRPLWLSARFRPTLAGRLVGLLFRNPVICIDTGTGRTWRVVPGSAVVGFPVQATAVTFAVASHAAWFYEPAIDVAVEALRVLP